MNKMSSTLLCIGHPLHGEEKKRSFELVFRSFHSHWSIIFILVFMLSDFFKGEPNSEKKRNTTFVLHTSLFSVTLYNSIHRSSLFFRHVFLFICHAVRCIASHIIIFCCFVIDAAIAVAVERFFSRSGENKKSLASVICVCVYAKE